MSTPTRRIPVGCAPAVNGHVTAPPRTAMNSRCFIWPPNLRTGHRSDLVWQSERGAMSALGQKQTYAPQQAMSALPPRATVKADIRNRSCLLYPRKRTYAAHKLMSALGQKRTQAAQQN